MSRDLKAVQTGVPAVPSVEPDDRAPVGLRVKGRYRVISELGTGVFGTVCLAEDEADGHEIAIRFLPRALVDLSQPTNRRRRADQSIVEVSKAHPGLVRVLEFGESENGQTFAAIELIRGRRLSAILSEGHLDVNTALRVAIDLGGAVETLHNMGLVHGALRPSNVMVGSDGRVTLMDVELTGVRTAQAANGIMVGEPPAEYLSPEQVRQVLATETTDVYAFAAILYEMLCGVPPFRGETREAVLAKHLTETPVPMRRRRRAVPVSVEAVVALALSKVPEPRPAIQIILNCLWEEANRPTNRWKRVGAIIGGGALATSIAVVAGWALLAPAPSAPVPAARQAPPPPEPAPVLAAPESSAPPSTTSPAPTLGAAGPAAVPASPTRAIPAPAPPPAPRPGRVERHEERRVPQTPAGLASERPAASNTDDSDPGAVIDWILEQRAAGQRGQ